MTAARAGRPSSRTVSNPAIAPATQICQHGPVDKKRILEILRDHEAELKASGLLHLRLFGSAARGEATPQSDVDLLADYDETMRISLLDLSRFEYQLADLLGSEVHLSSEKMMRPRIRERVLREAVSAF